VVEALRDGRERHSNFPRPVAPGQRDERRHGQTDIVFSEQARDGVTAGLCFRSRHDGAGLRAFERVERVQIPDAVWRDIWIIDASWQPKTQMS
jgi:hypothetical protein